MGVYIPNIEIPKSCDDCPHPTCTLWQSVNGGERNEKCPIVPVPPRGKLIDADSVSLEGGPYEYDEWCKWALTQYQDAPTIIEAEE